MRVLPVCSLQSTTSSLHIFWVSVSYLPILVLTFSLKFCALYICCHFWFIQFSVILLKVFCDVGITVICDIFTDCFAMMSALWFPLIPICEGIQAMLILQVDCIIILQMSIIVGWVDVPVLMLFSIDSASEKNYRGYMS